MEQERISCGSELEINGWPLGLPPVNARLSAASASSINMMLPSDSPSSSSSASSSHDSDSESTTSFCPEKSTTLGSLIGIQSSSQFALDTSDERHPGKSGRHRTLCCFLSCGWRLQEDSLEASPSLSHYWGMERREITHSSVQEDVEQVRDLEDDMEVHVVHGDVYCRSESWPRSRPSLRLILQQASPMSPWSTFNDFSTDQGLVGSRLNNFWHGCCGKLS